jgi:hypothetical protein|tara:strand:+ start:782 stop:967 length:186 start_codon:yes stop_codon:yes gene_type:complete
MGNGCFKKNYEPLIDIDYKLKQIIVEDIGICNICDRKDVVGYIINSVIEDTVIFVCKNCKT